MSKLFSEIKEFEMFTWPTMSELYAKFIKISEIEIPNRGKYNAVDTNNRLIHFGKNSVVETKQDTFEHLREGNLFSCAGDNKIWKKVPVFYSYCGSAMNAVSNIDTMKFFRLEDVVTKDDLTIVKSNPTEEQIAALFYKLKGKWELRLDDFCDYIRIDEYGKCYSDRTGGFLCQIHVVEYIPNKQIRWQMGSSRVTETLAILNYNELMGTIVRLKSGGNERITYNRIFESDCVGT